MGSVEDLINQVETDPSCTEILQTAVEKYRRLHQRIAWLRANMHPYFFISMKNEYDALANLLYGLSGMTENQRMILADRDNSLILAGLSRTGVNHDETRLLRNRKISSADFSNSKAMLDDHSGFLEVQKYEFKRCTHSSIAQAQSPVIPAIIRSRILSVLEALDRESQQNNHNHLIDLLWLNNQDYVVNSPPQRVAKIVHLFQQTIDHDGIYLHLEKPDPAEELGDESRLYFGVGNPPENDFLMQVMGIFKRLQVKVARAHGLTISNGTHPYFLGTFYVCHEQGIPLTVDSFLYAQVRDELYTTQILRSSSSSYQELVASGLTGGPDAALVGAMIGFCHTNMAHARPDSHDLEGVSRAFHNHPNITFELIRLFRVRFNPDLDDRKSSYEEMLVNTEKLVGRYTTGRRFLDDFRRRIFNCALLFIRYTLKTNFFVSEKHALIFRLDPEYLNHLGGDFTTELPADRPFRITYFHGRYGSGYHIGFSDIARGGWRTLITQGRDDYVTAANTLFKECYILAHTQHLKNKDIYEGGSKMVAVLDAGGNLDKELLLPRLYKLQYGFINAFLDIFVTEKGKAANLRVVDYYGEDEPIELGPDENMHDNMIEMVAQQARKRGYLLGSGIMSSKKVGINHKEYGVTSTGVIRFAEVAMKTIGIDMHSDRFSLKMTGGPNGDVAGNGMRILLQRCPQMQLKLLVDGTGALFDPQGADHDALQALVLKADIDGYDAQALNPGGFLLYRTNTRKVGLRELFRKVKKTESGLDESWITNDEFYREYNRLIFHVEADLFIPAGGRPETIDAGNSADFFTEDGLPTAKIIVEGANSFITPQARILLQQRGVVILRDASANKCGVISSSYEIIANLLLSDEEFLEHKEVYVRDVIRILNRRAEDEAELIFRRVQNSPVKLSYTEVSEQISREINIHYARLFRFFQNNSQLCNKALYRKTILSHLPGIIRENPDFRQRINRLPEKIKFAILAGEIASSIVYKNNEEETFQEMIEAHLGRIAR